MAKVKTLTNWTGLPKDFNPEEFEGFVYLICNVLTTKSYVGRKYLWARTRKKIKGRKRKKRCVKESDWRSYKSSSDDLKRDIEKFGVENFTFLILSIHKTRAQTNYEEVRQFFLRDVLHSKLPNGEYAYMNGNILGRYFRGKV